MIRTLLEYNSNQEFLDLLWITYIHNKKNTCHQLKLNRPQPQFVLLPCGALAGTGGGEANWRRRIQIEQEEKRIKQREYYSHDGMH